MTRIRTWVVSATTRSTNHYTITAILPAEIPVTTNPMSFDRKHIVSASPSCSKYPQGALWCISMYTVSVIFVPTWSTCWNPRNAPCYYSVRPYIPGGLVVRIRRSHRRGRGSIPRLGITFWLILRYPTLMLQILPNGWVSPSGITSIIYYSECKVFDNMCVG